MYTFAWLDLEMTGLDSSRDMILELALVLTDDSLSESIEGPCKVIHQPDSVLSHMNSWCVEQHGKTGLTEESRKSSETVDSVAQEVLQFLAAHMPEGEAILCGNSIHTDRDFLKVHMPEVHRFFHYRMLDVSALKIISERWYPEVESVEKKNNHRAVDDIYESIKELKHYREVLFKTQR
ncbi:MAG TPA: oligoribonuclease [Gammaproteobacteria bacterium]|nr:oligoribonuclease [Gammaproteobacteria bacterium]